MLEDNEINEILNGELSEELLLLFTKRFRVRCKTRFHFFRAHHEGNARDLIKNILNSNIDSAVGSEFIDSYDENRSDALVKIDLNQIDNWQYYEKAIIDTISEQLEDLKEVKSSLNNYIIAHRNESGLIIGQIRRLFPRQVLTDKGLNKLLFNDNMFNHAFQDDDNVEVDDNYDLIFILDNHEKIALIRNYNAFIEIFDMHDQIEHEAIEVVNSSHILPFFDNENNIRSLIETDRNIQNMFQNNVIKQGFREVTMDDLNTIKSRLGSNVDFEISNGKIILGTEEKKSLRDLIKSAGYHYNQSLYGKHIIEGKPSRIID